MDPRNPGHFFACAGLLELAGLGEAEDRVGRFVVDDGRPREARFELEADEGELRGRLRALRECEPEFEEHENATVRPARLRLAGYGELGLDWWLDEFREKAVSLKCWAGQVTTGNLFGELLPLVVAEANWGDLFYRPGLTKAKFGVDPRSAWNALDLGFSPNEHGRDAATFAAVEALAAIGLQTFRPDVRSRRGVGYSLWLTGLSATLARAAFREPWDGLRVRRYAFEIDKRGQSYKYFTFARVEN